MLADGNWVCTSRMYASFMADPRTILAELYDKGKGIVEKRWCENPNHHHEGKMKEWKLKNRGVLPSVDERKSESRYQGKEIVKSFNGGGKSSLWCCASKQLLGICSRDCPSKVKNEPVMQGGLF